MFEKIKGKMKQRWQKGNKPVIVLLLVFVGLFLVSLRSKDYSKDSGYRFMGVPLTSKLRTSLTECKPYYRDYWASLFYRSWNNCIRCHTMFEIIGKEGDYCHIRKEAYIKDIYEAEDISVPLDMMQYIGNLLADIINKPEKMLARVDNFAKCVTFGSYGKKAKHHIYYPAGEEPVGAFYALVMEEIIPEYLHKWDKEVISQRYEEFEKKAQEDKSKINGLDRFGFEELYLDGEESCQKRMQFMTAIVKEEPEILRHRTNPPVPSLPGMPVPLYHSEDIEYLDMGFTVYPNKKIGGENTFGNIFVTQVYWCSVEIDKKGSAVEYDFEAKKEYEKWEEELGKKCW